jgi:hypothetical protein
VATEIWSLQLRKKGGGRKKEGGRKEKEGGRKGGRQEEGGKKEQSNSDTVKSKGPHLAGGEKHEYT